MIERKLYMLWASIPNEGAGFVIDIDNKLYDNNSKMWVDIQVEKDIQNALILTEENMKLLEENLFSRVFFEHEWIEYKIPKKLYNYLQETIY